jgi:hypothetical protein
MKTDAKDAVVTDPRRTTGSHPVLCAYSPRWLSGPTPGYQGLCPTYQPDQRPDSESQPVPSRG